MAEPSSSRLDLPAGISEDRAFALALRHAPSLRLHREERHFPSDPESFRKNTRFRKSRRGRDSGWHKGGSDWTTGNDHGLDYYDIAWQSICDQSLNDYGAGPFTPDSVQNLRPRDPNNREGFLSSNGLFLQCRAASNSATSGNLPVEQQRNGRNEKVVTAPLFLDVAFLHDRNPPLVKVLYWFFYELNWWRVLYTHQGDWEHVTWIWTADDFTDEVQPSWAYFAQHDGGLVIDFHDLHADAQEPGRKIAYVDPAGHPTCPFVCDPTEYPIVWRTWETSAEWISRATWRDFAGAWGEVGSAPFTTGPLGPRFKRHGDAVRVTRKENGQLYAKVGK